MSKLGFFLRVADTDHGFSVERKEIGTNQIDVLYESTSHSLCMFKAAKIAHEIKKVPEFKLVESKNGLTETWWKYECDLNKHLVRKP
jgi:hypothetical protein